MGWFDEQIRQRKKEDNAVFAEALQEIAGAVTGEEPFFSDELSGANVRGELERILHYFHIKPRELPLSLKKPEEQLDYLLRPQGILKRRVRLKGAWYRDTATALLVTRTDGGVSAVLPGAHGCFFIDPSTGRRTRIGARNAAQFTENALCFYKPFSGEALSKKELLKQILAGVRKSDLLAYAAITLCAVGVTMPIPSVWRFLLSRVVTGEETAPLWAASFFLVCLSIVSSLLELIKGLLSGKMRRSTEHRAETAVMLRILSLPTDFFKASGAGKLANKLHAVGALCEALCTALVSGGLSLVLSFVYFVWIAAHAPTFLLPCCVITLATLAFCACEIYARAGQKKTLTAFEAEEQALTYSLFMGVSKIKLVGGEKRAFARWGKKYAAYAQEVRRVPVALKFAKTLRFLIPACGTLWLYAEAVRKGVSGADFYAFSAAYAVITAALASFGESIAQISAIDPLLESIQPFFAERPELAPDRQMVTRLSGGIEFNHVSFRYAEGAKPLFEDLSFKIRPGEYVAIVGKTGCGKSSLIRLLLGFETPQKGAIFYDGRDISTLDVQSLRRKLGIVLQDGKLFAGDIYSNIAVNTPGLTLEKAWEAAEKAGIAEDIRAMPMGMHTLISDGGGGVSGGQRQRILIARALAASPRILIFDEATSALDNVTQKTVTDSLASLKCTRIVVAHRLSTIKHCQRVLVLEDGRIHEEPVPQ